jgi:hypothetical protein
MPPQHIGQGIQRLISQKLMTASLGMEIIYVFVIILCGLLIYYGTRELYLLSAHKGIKYFRLSFLFFAISYFFRFLIKLIMFLFEPKQIANFSPLFFGPIMQMFFLYFSSMAVFYLLYSVVWKKIDSKETNILFFHLVAILVSILSIIFNNFTFYLVVNLFLFTFVTIIFFISHKNNKRKKTKNNLGIIYSLLFLFWILNILDILIPTILQSFQMLIYLSSIGIFISILYKVLRKTGAN